MTPTDTRRINRELSLALCNLLGISQDRVQELIITLKHDSPPVIRLKRTLDTSAIDALPQTISQQFTVTETFNVPEDSPDPDATNGSSSAR